jgi:hypothetical protein
VLRRNALVVRFGANDNFAPVSDLRIGEALVEA